MEKDIVAAVVGMNEAKTFISDNFLDRSGHIRYLLLFQADSLLPCFKGGRKASGILVRGVKSRLRNRDGFVVKLKRRSN
jgi:hypothetical protein